MNNYFLTWCVPHKGMPMFVKYSIADMPLFDEYVVISPSLVVYYNTNKDVPNPYLQKYGHILRNILGDAIVIACDEETGEPKDVSISIESELVNILERDTTQRLKVFRQICDDL